MAAINRRRFLAGSAGFAGAVWLGACSSGDGGSDGGGDAGGGLPDDPAAVLAAPGAAGLFDEDYWQSRVEEYLGVVTAELGPDNPTSIAGHLIMAQRDPDFTWDVDAVTVDSLADRWEQIDTLEDTRDFTFMYLHWMLALGQGDTPSTQLDPEVLDAIRQRMLDNRWRYDDPQVPGKVDSQWFWSENHILILAADEYLAGQAMPDETFTVSGLTGTESMARTKPVILDWVAERARFGFFEWHSHVYMLKNITPLIMLAELADDPEVVRAAAMGLDLCLLDMAAHTHVGNYVASRGRTYKKDKMKGTDEDTFSTNKFLFDDTDQDWTSTSDNGATYFCGAQRYRPPLVALEMATAPAPGVVRERHGIFVDGAAPVTEDPEAPFGYDFDDPANLSFWWSQGAVGMWQIAGISLSEAEEHQLFDTPLLEQVKLLADLNGRDPERIAEWEQANHAIINFGHLREANTYAWRGDAVSLASVLDHRAGQQRDQIHTWTATIDEEALVFTTHPSTDRAESTDWGEDDGPGYWTGEASIPRTAQHEKIAIAIYRPEWDEATDELLWSVFPYRDFTHAYFPTERFDEVRQEGNWTVGRKGDGYVALWSWRTPTWRDYDPAVYATDDMTEPFDLVAEGGPDNVWVCEVGEAADGSFDEWADAIVATEPEVTEVDDGFEVSWSSPSSGEVAFGSTAPFTVDGEEVAQADFARHESEFATIDHLDTTYAYATPSATLELDFEAMTRSTDSA
ncbi:MAG: hypothetical protein KDA98_11475 [Acidimicrobiales bacterium]|nr:hypothetical protein [Acidimicrobiales bacterium]